MEWAKSKGEEKVRKPGAGTEKEVKTERNTWNRIEEKAQNEDET
jgi:hypothetical protein